MESTTHRKLCLTAARWLRQNKLDNPSCGYVAVEITAATKEKPDVFGWCYWTTAMIECKATRADFLADCKKEFRQKPEDGVGEHRYYCCPKGMITPDELPDKWGLLWADNGKVECVKNAERQRQNPTSEHCILSSIMRREGIKPQIFDYRHQNGN